MAETAKRYNSILNIIEDRLIPDDAAKEARGEVFTPLNLVREMLFGVRKSAFEKLKGVLPDIKSKEYNQLIWGIDEEGNFLDDDEKDRLGGIPLEIWRDPETKWIDPANGIGNFPVVAFYMLDYQLGKHASGNNSEKYKGDKNKIYRRRHIVKNMLYMIELNKGNVNTSRKIFEKIVTGVTPNIVCANTLEMTDEKLKKEFGINKFHVIMGNPPYNEGGTAGNGRTIWPDFIKKGNNKKYTFPGILDILTDNGYVALVIPSSWRNGLENIWNTLKENSFIWIKMSDDFPQVNLPIDAWLLKKGKEENKTTYIIDRNKIISKEDIKNFPFIPNFGITIFKKILDISKENKEKLNFLSQSKFDPTGTFGKLHIQKNKDAKHIYPIIKTIIEGGPDIYYSDVKDNLQDIDKVVIADYTYFYPHIDKSFAGIGRHAYYIPISNITEGEEIVSFLNSKLMQYMNLAIKIAGGGVQYQLLRYFPHIKKLFKNDKEVYFKFSINDSEQMEIENYINTKLKGNIEDDIKFIKNIGVVKKTRGKKNNGAPKPRRVTRKLRRT